MEIVWNLSVKKGIEPFSIGVGIIKNVTVVNEAKNLESIKKEVFDQTRSSFTIETIKDTPIIKAYRKFSWRYLNIDPTKTRPSGEALVRRVLKNQRIPIINNIVFSINLASIKTQLAFSGFTLQRVVPPLEIRFAKPEEEFQGIGTRHRILVGNELLLADSKKILCIYAYGDADVTKVTKEMRDLLLIAYGVPGISQNIIEQGIKIGLSYVQETGGGEIEDILVTTSAHQEP